MFDGKKEFTRRNFLKNSLLGLGSIWVFNQDKISHLQEEDWVENQAYGRVCKGKVNLYLRPTIDSLILDARYEKVWQAGSVRDAAILMASGVKRDGKKVNIGHFSVPE